MDLMRSLPLGLYLEQPVTWLHRLDSRVKLGWLLAFLLMPVLASGVARLGLVALLVLLTVGAGIPWRVWRQQLVWLLLVGFFATLLTALSPDGYGLKYQPRSPADLNWSSLNSSNNQDPASGSAPAGQAIAPEALPQPTRYRYWLVQQGWLKVSRRSLGLGVRVGSLVFILIYSTTLFLLTTAPEEIAAGLESLMAPLGRLGLPVAEVTLTLTLSLRFIPLVLEEVQNLVRSIRTRAINWRRLGWRGTIKIWLILAERLLENLLMRAEQMATAMQVRGFTSPDRHSLPLSVPRLRARDGVAIGVLLLIVGARLWWGWQP
ncbi:energy-coupling factor transporter transmembrane protein EcfT [Limnothrix sp. FACHB-708]|uniref:energy-coupling factor transporter transmembrane component T family protein n=1 Tax=unclassified Limnothrix TaxID=2632864 RepID=UPI001685EB6B|nr:MULTISPECIES: energy-coupling factor transporter transmembrane protein EcfT [unclassified Limnothrix]MBD2554905.1 energy-coupling factor transporter transmembrane protein EcfT [Limnothrix sp. FACHB-708]MBD2592364.1 energy-coupling factor transporter transmembrane protein EcfT [Limnothrix sp. FACHB-406]